MSAEKEYGSICHFITVTMETKQPRHPDAKAQGQKQITGKSECGVRDENPSPRIPRDCAGKKGWIQ